MSEKINPGNLSCEVVRDLMPLYVEELTSEETNRQIATHIGGCPACAQALGMQQARLEIEKNDKGQDAKAIRFLKGQAVKRIALVLAIIVLIYFSLLAGDRILFSSQMISEEDIYSAGCYQLSDGRVLAAFGVDGLSPAQITNAGRWQNASLYTTFGSVEGYQFGRSITLYTNNFNRLFGKADERGQLFFYAFDPDQIYSRQDSAHGFISSVQNTQEDPAYRLSKVDVNGYTIWQDGDDAASVSPEEETLLLEALNGFQVQEKRIEADALSMLKE